MKQFTLFAAFFLLLFSACQDTPAPADATRPGLRLLTNANPEWQYQNLRIYPVLADAAVLQASASAPGLKTLAEAMQTEGFRITELKQFGRARDNWYNGLTVQNKSRDTVFLMSGDVVTGGNQDRVIAYDDVVLPGTLKNIEVFCVEAGRSSYYNPEASEQEKQVAAFRGYYNVASPRVRQAVLAGNQHGVWEAVEHVASANNALTSTKTYAGLETANVQKEKREAYLRFFDGKFTDLPGVTGLVAVCNGEVVGVDIFNRPELFRRQFKALLHGYAAEAAVATHTQALSTPAVEAAFQSVARLANDKAGSSAKAGKFSVEGNWVHLFMK